MAKYNMLLKASRFGHHVRDGSGGRLRRRMECLRPHARVPRASGWVRVVGFQHHYYHRITDIMNELKFNNFRNFNGGPSRLNKMRRTVVVLKVVDCQLNYTVQVIYAGRRLVYNRMTDIAHYTSVMNT